MPLTLRSNGSTNSNIITATWFNDFYNLLTGSMQDQEVTIKNNLVLQAIGAAPSVGPTLALAASTNLGIGVYGCAYTFISPDGESLPSPTVNITTTTGNQAINWSAIAVGPTGTTGRRLYRTAVGGSILKLVTTIANNTATTFADTTVDGSLGALAPTFPSFGGALVIKDAAGVVRHVFGGDGSLFQTQTGTTISGSINGTITLLQPLQGTVKMAIIQMAAYNSTSKSFVLPTAFVSGASVWTGNIGNTGGVQFLKAGAIQNIDIITGLATGGGSDSSGQSAIFGHSFGEIEVGFDTVSFPTTANSNHTATVFIVGS